MSNEKILLIDDEPDFLDIIGEFLRDDEGYQVTCASNALDALDKIEHETFDLVLSDINMPGMKGFELIALLSQTHPALKTALITAYDVHDYLLLAKNFDIGNIITKTTPFNFKEIGFLVHNLITEDVFGLKHYIPGTLKSYSIKHSNEIEPLIQRIVADCENPLQKRKFRQALGEIVINAVYYGAREERGDQKSSWQIDVALKPEEEILVTWGADAEKMGVSVQDHKGKLKKKEVLFWLERNSTKDRNGISTGLYDDHGKGLFITRETIDRFIINIKKNVMTEIVLINYTKNLYEGHRPLWIHEF